MKDITIRVIGMIVVSIIGFLGVYHAFYISDAGQTAQLMQFSGSVALFLIGFIIFVVEWESGNSSS